MKAHKSLLYNFKFPLGSPSCQSDFVKMKSLSICFLSAFSLVLVSNVYGLMDCRNVKVEYRNCCTAAVRYYFTAKNEFLLKCVNAKTTTFELCELQAEKEALDKLDYESIGVSFKHSLGGRRLFEFLYRIEKKTKECKLKFFNN